MYRLLFAILLSSGCLWAQNSPNSAGNSNSAPPDSKSQESPSTSSASPPRRPNLDPPRSDRVNGDTLDEGQSSSKETQIDLSPPEDDAKAHPKSSDKLMDVEGSPSNSDVNEFHPWNPHKAAKDVEVGDFYFKRKNYKAAEDRYREALFYKQDDAMATFKLALCLEKMARPGEARTEYEKYLKILPYGPQAPDAKKALERLKNSSANANLGK